MNALLIQPPPPPQPLEAIGPADLQHTATPWDLLCLRTYLLEHTRHLCDIIDCGFFDDLETGLVARIQERPEAEVAVIHATGPGLGEAAAVLDILKRHFPAMKTALCGPYASQYPQQAAAMPRVDFVLAGDPEPILRNLLDHFDVEPRLQRVPGLLMNESGNGTPYWLDNLRGLSLPDWQGIFWPAYRTGGSEGACRAYARISRGHSNTAPDRAWGAAHEPLRLWPADRLAATFQRCGCMGITEVFLDDPPGVWTHDRLHEWCVALERARNIQSWALQLLPAVLSQDTVALLRSVLCKRVEFIVPSCSPEILAHHGSTVKPSELRGTLALLTAAGIRAHVRLWVGGPEETGDEESRVVHMIRALDYSPYSLEPFPFVVDSPLYEDFRATSSTHIEDWVHWSRDPWLLNRPVPLWGGNAAIPRLTASFAKIQKMIQHDPRRVMKKLFADLTGRNWIAALEDRLLGLLTQQPPK